mgnify:CR=1 FL=1|jgi:hypothetical protein|tara:strand:+ start:350 stop:481 length:132 start_codon:yes stop_codon:yes gene_type:complete
MEELSQTDFKILAELDKKIGYYTQRINECRDEKRWIINRRENH